MSTLINNFKAAWRSEEHKSDIVITACAVIAVVVNVRHFFFI